MCRRDDFGQDVHGVENIRVGHQWQVDEFLNLAASKVGPDSIVLALHLISGWMRPAINADAPEVFKAYLHGAVAPIQGRVQRKAQTRKHSEIVFAPCTLYQHRKP